MTDTLTPVAHGDTGHSEEHHEAHPTVTGISNEKLGMWVFLGSECLMFGGLISTYMLYKNRPGSLTSVRGREIASSPIRPSALFDIPFTSVSSFILLASSLTMVFAVSAANRRDPKMMRLWLATTAVLGSLFVGGQVYEFTTFVREGLGYTTNVASSAFYTLTGFHGVHVSIGILMLVSLIGLSLKGKLPVARAEVVEIIGLYWHFVDVVWILIFTVVYLIP
jgi:heme/copper-type cytochrome/quinol oxidase subunit 3